MGLKPRASSGRTMARRAHELAPADYAKARTLARELGADGRHDEAMSVCRTTLQHLRNDRHRAELLHLIGLSLALTEHPVDAIAVLDEARSLAPQLQMAQAYAVANLHLGKPHRALDQLRRAPVDTWSLNARGLCHAALGELDRAEAYYREAIARRTPRGAVAAAEANLAALLRR